jgi:hypothetical protein
MGKQMFWTVIGFTVGKFTIILNFDGVSEHVAFTELHSDQITIQAVNK